MHITGAMREPEANVGDNPELTLCKIAPALEVVAHCGLNGNLACLEFIGFQIFFEVLLAEQFHNPPAAFTPFFTAILVSGHQKGCCAKVISRNLINFRTLGSLWNNTQAQNIVLPRNGCYRELDKIHALVTKFTGDVAIQLKSPPGIDGAESVADHPHGPKGNAHQVMFCGDLTAKHKKFKET